MNVENGRVLRLQSAAFEKRGTERSVESKFLLAACPGDGSFVPCNFIPGQNMIHVSKLSIDRLFAGRLWKNEGELRKRLVGKACLGGTFGKRFNRRIC